MKTKVKKWLVKHGNAICAVAVSLASLSSLCCRGCWYQPEEPEGLKEFAKNHMETSYEKSTIN